MKDKKEFCILIGNCIRIYNEDLKEGKRNIEVFKEIVREYENLLKQLEEKDIMINKIQNELDRAKINSNYQNKEIAIKLVEIYQNGKNKVSEGCLTKSEIIEYYKLFLEELNQ